MIKKIAPPLFLLLLATPCVLWAQQQTAPPLLQTAPPLKQTAPPLSVDQVLAKMAANTKGLNTYEVPVEIRIHVKKVISIPIRVSGERYFEQPDKGALKLHSVPQAAKAFSNLYASLGTPMTWPRTYNITLQTLPQPAIRPLYELRGTYKQQSNVQYVLLDVDANTFDPVEVRWFYSNGATIFMNVEEGPIDGKYRLPLREVVDLNFPQYSGHATIDYGTYTINQPIPDSVFAQ